MFVEPTLTLLRSLAADPFALALAIILATLALEDAATIAVGLLASQMVLAPLPAVLALLAGTILGDVALHGLGRAAAGTRWGRRLRVRPAVRKAEAWLSRRADLALAIARFVPGLRLPVYAASGFMRLPTKRVTAIIAIVSVIWTPGLFWLSASAGAAGATLPAPLAALLGIAGLALISLAPRLTRRWLVA